MNIENIKDAYQFAFGRLVILQLNALGKGNLIEIKNNRGLNIR